MLPAIKRIKENLTNLLNYEAKTLFNEFKCGSYPEIGSVYALTLVYFFAKGKFPIIDKFAYVASEAIINGIKPNCRFKDPPIDWNIYQKHMDNLVKIFNTYSIDRPEDSGSVVLWTLVQCEINKKKCMPLGLYGNGCKHF